MNIDFENFTEMLLKLLKEKLGEEYQIYITKVRKNNGILLTGLVIKKEKSSVFPTVYIDSFFHEEISRKEVEQTAELLYQRFQAADLKETVDLSNFLEFETAKENLSFKLINRERNKELLKLVPHRQIHDLAIVYYYTVQEAPFFGKAVILIYNSHLEYWKIEQEKLHETAFFNAPHLFPAQIEDIESLVREFMMEKDEAQRLPMYVLTNRQKLQGAACMLYPEILKDFGNKTQQNFFVLPSSVHEVILVPDTGYMSQEALRDIVTDINRTQVAEEEILADSVYYFSRQRQRLEWLC